MSNAAMAGEFAAVGLALYAGHHVGDYWVQTDHQAQHKGDAGREGRLHCLLHVISYLLTQVLCLAIAAAVLCLAIAAAVLGLELSYWGVHAALLVSGVTHYLADRREHGLMFWLARKLPGKANFLKLGVPRPGQNDNPSLGTGAWALDQSWHIFWGVFVAGLLAVAL